MAGAKASAGAEEDLSKVPAQGDEADESDEDVSEHDDVEDDDSSSESSAAPEIGLDQNGRIVPGVGGPINYDFRSMHNCVNVSEILLEDCKTVFSARQAEDEDAYSSGETFFVRACEEPKSALEQMAMDVFKFHAHGLTFDPEKSGAEWWTLVLDEESDVTFHWDKDYGLEDYGVNVFPHISTVTYLANAGGATLVLQKLAPPHYSAPIVGPCGETAFCSKPCAGKHISFDGRLLHAASSDLLSIFSGKSDAMESSSQGTRVTFLVNLWFNHIPRDAEPLPEKVRADLKMPFTANDKTCSPWTKTVEAAQATAEARPVLVDVSKDGPKEELTYDFGDQDNRHKVKLIIPKTTKPTPTDSIFLRFGPSVVPQLIKQ